jgi:hypothetical protein
VTPPDTGTLTLAPPNPPPHPPPATRALTFPPIPPAFDRRVPRVG